MKKLILVITLIGSITILNSCGVHSANVQNQNQNSTQVHLTTNNYKYVDKVSGQAAVTYVLSIGGLSKKQLYQNAYADMVDQANLQSGSRALVNIAAEEHIGGFPPFFQKRTVTVSAHVIEYID